MVSIEEARNILRELGLPLKQQNRKAALTILVMSGLKPPSRWLEASRRSLRVHDILESMKTDWNETVAENTREDVRRQVLHQFEQARLVDRNPDDPSLATNSPKTHYSLTPGAIEIVRSYGKPAFPSLVADFKSRYGTLIAEYQKKRSFGNVPLQLPKGAEIFLSAGDHNLLQKRFIEDFCPRYAPEATLVYVGDTAKKNLYKDEELLVDIGVRLSDHDKLPDIILLDSKRNWLFLAEMVTSHGPVSPKRERELRVLFSPTGLPIIFITAFPNSAKFKRFAADIAWETEVWIADSPDHLIHYNGEKFLGPPLHD